MASSLITVGVEAPGFRGLNLEKAGSYLSPEWATVAHNLIVDDAGRLACRPGYTDASDNVGDDMPQITEYIASDGTREIITMSTGIPYKLISGTLTAISHVGWTGPTNNNWKFQNFNDYLVAWQDGEVPKVYDGSTFNDITPSSGTVPGGNDVLAAFGRLWAFDETHTVMRYSDLLIYDVWDDHSSPGSSGSIDLKSVWVHGMDRGVSIREFNGFLIIFCENSIIIYGDGSGSELGIDPTNMFVNDIITGVGCIARDSIQDIGTDMLFLSNSGVRALSRVIQEKSMPQTDETFNVHTELATRLRTVDVNTIRSTYNDYYNYYLLLVDDIIYCIDTRMRMEDGTRRITTWDSNGTKALFTSLDRTTYGSINYHIVTYGATTDNDVTIPIYYTSGWMKLSDEERYYILKKLKGIFQTTSNATIVFKWAYDFKPKFFSYVGHLEGSPASYYGIAKYGLAFYSSEINVNQAQAQLSGFGEAVKMGIEVTGSEEFAIFKMELHAKTGRVN